MASAEVAEAPAAAEEVAKASADAAEAGGAHGVIEVADEYGTKHKHSGTSKTCTLQVYGCPFQQMRFNVKVSTQVTQVKDMVGNTFNVDPEKLYFFVKEGNYFRQQREHEQVREQVFVKGISSFKREFIPEIEHNIHFPGWNNLPMKIRKIFPPPAPKTPTVRVYIFYGSADSFAQWAHFASMMPSWVDFAIFEWPGHGQRKEEQVPPDVDGLVDDAMEGLKAIMVDHAEGGEAAGTPFAFVGHSIGALVMVGVAERVREQYKVDPWTVIVLDRAPPHIAMCSEYGAELLRTEPAKFNVICNPMTRKMGEDAESRSMFKMWQDEIRLQQDTKPKGSFKFNCKVHVAAASRNWMMDKAEIQQHLDEETKKDLKERDAIYGSKTGSSAMFDREIYDDWKVWTTQECAVYDVDADHFSLKMHEHFLYFLIETLGKLKHHKPGAAEEPPPVAPAAAA